jgi:hypothetical protein
MEQGRNSLSRAPGYCRNEHAGKQDRSEPLAQSNQTEAPQFWANLPTAKIPDHFTQYYQAAEVVQRNFDYPKSASK